MTNELIIPGFDNIDNYITRVMSIPLLTPEREHELAINLRDNNDSNAAKELIYSHLRLVVGITVKYYGYGLPKEDLIQEGNIGLMQAVKKFDPDRGVRLSSFAIPHIKYEIQQYIVDNCHIGKIATTKPLRKAFYNIRSLKHKLGVNGKVSNEQIAKELNIKPEEVAEMEKRMQFPVYIDHNPDFICDGDDYFINTIPELTDTRCPLHYMLVEEDKKKEYRMKKMIDDLPDRERDIITNRCLVDKKETLATLSKRYGVSGSRIDQIQKSVIKDIKMSLN